MENLKKVEQLFANEAFCVEFFESIEDALKIKTLFVENGINVTDEEVNDFIELAKRNIELDEKNELSENEMEEVNGGLVGWVIAGAASAVFFGYQTYKNTKALNKALGYCKR